MSFKFDRAAEEEFLNKPVITQVAGKITGFAKQRYSDRLYAKKPYALNQTWSATEEFRAGAYVLPSGDHEIRLSYGTAIEIYRDAFVLPELCIRVLGETVFDPIFDKLSYGNDRKDVLPAGLSASDAKFEIISLTTTWLYLHEQAHLMQRHGEIARLHGAAELLSNDNGLDEIGDSKQIEGRDAALRHAFEFAADYEAITYLVMVNCTGMTAARLWCLAVGLMCMFQRFHEGSTDSVAPQPKGTHPHPAVRMRMAMNRIEKIFEMEGFAEHAKWDGGVVKARAVMDHAVYTANVFWHLRYLGLDARSPFLDLVVATLRMPTSYQLAVATAWQSVRPEIVAGHLGDGEGVTMFIRSPAAIGERP